MSRLQVTDSSNVAEIVYDDHTQRLQAEFKSRAAVFLGALVLSLGMTAQGFLGGDIAELPRLKEGKARAAIHRQWAEEHLAPGGAYEVNLDGPAIINHVQVTIAPRNPRTLRQTILEMYWDGEAEPSVRSPLADFFCDAFGGQSVGFANLLTGNRSGAWHCYFPMPFRKSARVVFRNLSAEKLTTIAHEMDFRQVPALEADVAYFHASFRRENPTVEGVPYTILEARGRGHYIGLNLQMQSRADSFWFMEGNTEVYVDGEARPSVENVGTEDYFNGGWYFDQGLYTGPYSGLTVKDESLHRIAAYRFLVHDAIPFGKSVRVTIHHGEESKGKAAEADYASVAYWYQLEPHAPLPGLPADASKLLVMNPVLSPRPGYALDPSKASVTDARGAAFVWRADCADDKEGDHDVGPGWEDTRDHHNYLAYGRALVRGQWKRGVIALAYPDTNRIRAVWPLEARANRALRLTCGLTDQAVRRSRKGAKVEAWLSDGARQTSLLAEELKAGEARLATKTRALTGQERQLIIEIDNQGSEFWSVVYLDADLSPPNEP